MKPYTFIISLSFLIISCSKSKETAQENFEISAQENTITLTDLQIKNTGIITSDPQQKNISETFRLTGTVDVPPQGLASVSAPSGGYVRKSPYMPGDKITQGQILAILEDPGIIALQQDYLLAKSNQAYTAKDYSRQKELNQAQASADKVMQKAQTDAHNQEILLKAMAQRLRLLGIDPQKLTPNNITRTVAVRAPISGFISTVDVHMGQYVSPNDKMFGIVNTNDTHLVLKVFEKDLSKVHLGQSVFAFTNEAPEKRYEAEIILISQDFGSDRSVLVQCHFKNYDPKLIPGTFINAETEIQRERTQSIADDAIVSWDAKTYVFEEIKPKTYKMIPVMIGAAENGYTKLINTNVDLSRKKIVTKGAYQLLMALKNVEE